MIESESEYQRTMEAVDRFKRALDALGHQSSSGDGLHPLLRKAQEDAIHSEIEALGAELRAYERRRSARRAAGPPSRQRG